MSELDRSNNLGENVVAFPVRDESKISNFQGFDPDDLISAMLGDFSDSLNEDSSNEFEESLDVKVQNRQDSFFDLDDLDLQESLLKCDEILSNLDKKLKRLSFYTNELQKIL